MKPSVPPPKGLPVAKPDPDEPEPRCCNKYGFKQKIFLLVPLSAFIPFIPVNKRFGF
jgi:hypothetical protein